MNDYQLAPDWLIKDIVKRIRHFRSMIDGTVGQILTMATQKEGPNCGGPLRSKESEKRLWKLLEDIRKEIEELPLERR